MAPIEYDIIEYIEKQKRVYSEDNKYVQYCSIILGKKLILYLN